MLHPYLAASLMARPHHPKSKEKMPTKKQQQQHTHMKDSGRTITCKQPALQLVLFSVRFNAQCDMYVVMHA